MDPILQATHILEFTLRESLPSTFHDSLLSGVRLCRFHNELYPAVKAKFRSGGRPGSYESGSQSQPQAYEQNVLSFLSAVRLVLKDHSLLFTPQDLQHGEAEGLVRVAHTILALAVASGRRFPTPRQLIHHQLVPSPSVTYQKQAMISDSISVLSVDSSGSSSDWCRVDATISPMQGPSQAANLSRGDSWIAVSKNEAIL